MRVSLNWIKKFVDINGIDHKEIADKLTMSGLEVEGIEVVKAPKGVVVGKVVEKGKHPNADKLSVCKVFDGTEYYQVVCGASNVEAGQTIPFAKIGAELPNGMKLKEAKLRGVESRGMICSAAELGLEEESDGILVLPDSYVAGKDINEYIEIEDVVLEINITPNRADCLSILGVAREIAVLFGRDVKNYSFVVEEDEEQGKDLRFVKILNKIDCPAYYGRIIKGVKLGESPDWIKTRLRKVGIRPINNIVDITNYVMIEYGQPLHAFDLRMVEDGIIVRNAEDGEKIITLDGKERVLNSNMLVIADSKKVLAIAGIMGGEYSGIQNDTVDVFLECAYFRPESIRLTSRRLGLKTDSSYRYERGIDGGSTYKMIDYAASLMAEISGGRVLKGILNDGIDEFKNRLVEFSTAKINSLLGVTLVEDSMIKILKDLGFEIVKNGDGYIATVPSYRQDISLWQDLAEEVARIYGYDKIPVTVPKIYASSKPSDKLQSKIRQIKDILVTMGYNEVINYSFMGKEFLSKFLDDRFIFIKNPLSQDMDTMRSAVFPGVIKSIITNY
ncbi:MAG: phenylalanine--tRNA ligase subunit beta, partial [Deferribacterales bacterium]